MKKIFISIINYNGAANTLECLRSLVNLSIKGFSLHVVVVDNASKEPFTLPQKEFSRLSCTVIHNKTNLGFSGGHNTSIQFALKHLVDYVMILNNDTLVDEKLVLELLKVAESDKGIGVLGPKIYFSKGFEFHKDRYAKEDLGKVIWYAGGIMDWNNVLGFHRGVDEIDNGQYDKLEETEFVSGCCMLIRREILQKIGRFDERYFLYYEDIDFNTRVKKADFKILYVPSAVLWHKNAASVGGSGSSLQDYYITRNRLLLGFSYASFQTKLALVRESLETLMSGREWQRRGIVDFYLRKFGKGRYKIN